MIRRTKEKAYTLYVNHEKKEFYVYPSSGYANLPETRDIANEFKKYGYERNIDIQRDYNKQTGIK